LDKESLILSNSSLRTPLMSSVSEDFGIFKIYEFSTIKFGFAFYSTISSSSKNSD